MRSRGTLCMPRSGNRTRRRRASWSMIRTKVWARFGSAVHSPSSPASRAQLVERARAASSTSETSPGARTRSDTKPLPTPSAPLPRAGAFGSSRSRSKTLFAPTSHTESANVKSLGVSASCTRSSSAQAAREHNPSSPPPPSSVRVLPVLTCKACSGLARNSKRTAHRVRAVGALQGGTCLSHRHD
jgi:hypothetical protein